MSEIKHPAHLDDIAAGGNIADRFDAFWNKYGKRTGYVLLGIIILVAGFLGYKYMVSDPNEAKASEAIFHAEEYYRMDSLKLALNGDNANAGFLKIISRYGGTRAANLAHFYAGVCYLKTGDFNNAVKYLKDFSTSQKQVEARAHGSLGDAYSELNKKEEAVEEYKKAGTLFEKDDVLSPEYLFRAGYLYESMGKNKEAIEMYQAIKDKYPNSEKGRGINNYLGRLGVTQ
jgi:tetratricopeptide (TPR) repeat protein